MSKPLIKPDTTVAEALEMVDIPMPLTKNAYLNPNSIDSTIPIDLTKLLAIHARAALPAVVVDALDWSEVEKEESLQAQDLLEAKQRRSEAREKYYNSRGVPD